MSRYWISWWTDSESCEDADRVPFSFWISGERPVHVGDGVDWDELQFSICACLDAVSEKAAWKRVQKYFAVLETRFCTEHEADWTPGGDRFQFKGKLRT